MSITANAFLVAHGLGHGLSHGDAHVFHRVMAVDMQVALALHAQIDQPMARNLFQHVVEKPDAGMELGVPGAIQIDGDGDVGLGRLAGNFGGTRGGFCRGTVPQ